MSPAEVFRVWPPSGAIWLILGGSALLGLIGLAGGREAFEDTVMRQWILPVRAVFLFIVLANYWSAGQWPPKLQEMVAFGVIPLMFDAVLAGTAEDWGTVLGNAAAIYLNLILLLIYFAA